MMHQLRGWCWELEEEAQHLPTGVGPAWLGVRSGRATAGPSVAGSMQDPLLQNPSPALIHLNGAGVTHPSGRLTAGDGDLKIRRSLRLGNDLIPVDGVDDHVAVTVKHDGRRRAAGPVALARFPYAGRPALPHRFEG